MWETIQDMTTVTIEQQQEVIHALLNHDISDDFSDL